MYLLHIFSIYLSSFCYLLSIFLAHVADRNFVFLLFSLKSSFAVVNILSILLDEMDAKIFLFNVTGKKQKSMSFIHLIHIVETGIF